MDFLKRRDFLKLAGVTAASVTLSGCFESQSAAAKNRPRPNIVFIMTDDHDRDALSCYGSKVNTTPNLDRLAKEGMLFEHCLCTNSICAPSRAVVLTGKYSHINGKIDNRNNPFDGSQQTFPKLLQSAGYQTAIVGKWHLRSAPTGFDYWNVLPGQGKYHNPEMIEMGEKTKREGYVTDLITDYSIDWLKGRDEDKPFCLVYQHKAPHRNWQPDDKHKDMYKGKEIPLPDTFDDDYSTRSDAAREQAMTIMDHLRVPSDTKVHPPEGLEGRELKKWKYQRYMEDYLACVASVDDNVGRFLDYLEESGLAENTVVFYTSDQGFYLGTHGWFDKRFMYEESLHMPLMVRYPGVVKAGSVNSEMVSNLDFASTFLELAGTDVPGDIQGDSLLPLLKGKTPDTWRKSFYYHYYEYPGAHSVKRHYGVRTERYKLIHFYYDIDAWELYDLKKDPNELNNVYGDPKNAGLVKKLKAEIKRLRKKYKDSEELQNELLPAKAKSKKTKANAAK
jgi:arylsulfatase A-like enzyme